MVAGCVNTGLGFALGATWPALPLLSSALLIGFLGYGLSLVLFVLALRGLGAARTGAYFSTAPFMWAAVAVLASFQFVYQVKRAQIDPTLVLFTTVAFYGLCRHLLLGPAWRWFWGGCFAAGLGVITKGVGFLPLLALLPFAFFARRRWQGVATMGESHGWRWAAGALAFFAAIALWLVPVLAVGLSSGNPEHAEYLRNILFKQTAQRYADPWHHTEPFWYFSQVVLFFWLPFSLALPWLLRPWREAWRARDAKVWLPLAQLSIVLLWRVQKSCGRAKAPA